MNQGGKGRLSSVTHHRANAPTSQSLPPINAKRLGHTLGLREKCMRQWLRRHCYQQRKRQWRFTEVEARRIVNAYRNGGRDDA
jgi:hypothetical protein